MKARWQQLAEFLNARSLRERVLVFAAVAGLLVLAGFQWLLQPLAGELAALKKEGQAVRTETAGLRQEMARLEPSRFREERDRLTRKRADLEGRIVRQRRALQSRVGEFIRPARLMAFFEDLLLARNAGTVRVKRFDGVEREPLPLNGEEQALSRVKLFRKGAKVVVETDYASTLDFLERIEGLPWAVQVSDLDYRVLEYPRAEVTLTAHTFVLETGGAANDG